MRSIRRIFLVSLPIYYIVCQKDIETNPMFSNVNTGFREILRKISSENIQSGMSKTTHNGMIIHRARFHMTAEKQIIIR